jgi:hypothetical protein
LEEESFTFEILGLHIWPQTQIKITIPKLCEICGKCLVVLGPTKSNEVFCVEQFFAFFYSLNIIEYKDQECWLVEKK